MSFSVKTVNIQMTDELHEAMRRKSEETGVTVSFYLRNAVKQWVNGTDRLSEQRKEIERTSGMTRPKQEK